MKKKNLTVTAALVSVSLLAGCGTNDADNRNNALGTNQAGMNTANNFYYRNHNANTPIKPLDVTGTQGNTGTNPNKFADVPGSEWYYDHVLWGSNLGLIDGYIDGTFQPNKPMTRAEVIKIIRSLADKGYININQGTGGTGGAGGTGGTASPSPTADPIPTGSPTPTATVSPPPAATTSPPPAGSTP